MTDADSFYDKLLESLSIPGLEIAPRNEPVKSSHSTREPLPVTEALEGVNELKGLDSGGDGIDSKDSITPLAAPDLPTRTRVSGLGEKSILAGTAAEESRDEALPDAPSLKEPRKPDPPANLPLSEQPRPVSTGGLKVRTPAALEAELRRRLLESGLKKRKSFPGPEIPPTIVAAENAEKRRKLQKPDETVLVKNALVVSETRAPEPNSVGTDKAAELRRRLLCERTTYEKQKSSAQKTTNTASLQAPPVTKPVASQSPISISSDEDEELATEYPSHPISLPPRPPPRFGFRLRISVPFSASASGYIVMQTEHLPLATTFSSIIELFGPPNERDYLYFPHLKPKPPKSLRGVGCDQEEEVEEEEEDEEESGQKFYYEPGAASTAEPQEAAGKSIKAPTRKPSDSRLRSAKSSLNSAMSDFSSGDNKEGPNKPGWVVGRKTLEDVWAVGMQEVECVLIRAGELDSDQGQDGEMCADGEYFQQNEWGSVGDFSHPGKLSNPESSGQWGFSAPGFSPENMNFGYTSQQWTGPYLDPNMPSPSTPWFSQQQNFPQQSPIFPHPQQPQPDFPPEGNSGPQAMHWIPGHTDYTTAGWMYGFNGTNEAMAPQDSSNNDTPIPAAPESRSAPGSAKKRTRGGRRKKEKARSGPISSPGVSRIGGPPRPGH